MLSSVPVFVRLSWLWWGGQRVPRDRKEDRLKLFWGSHADDSWNFKVVVLFLGQHLAVLTAVLFIAALKVRQASGGLLRGWQGLPKGTNGNGDDKLTEATAGKCTLRGHQARFSPSMLSLPGAQSCS